MTCNELKKLDPESLEIKANEYEPTANFFTSMEQYREDCQTLRYDYEMYLRELSTASATK